MTSVRPGPGEPLFVTGATGFIGRRLVQRLLGERFQVRVLTRREGGLPEDWVDRVDVRHGDLSDQQTLLRHVIGCRRVFHLAGELRDEARMQPVNVKGTENLLNACESARIEHVVHLSSVGVIGARGSRTVNESTACTPRGEYEQSKYAAERLALDWATRTAIPLAALRPTIVFGEKPLAAATPDSMLAWLRAIQAGRFVFMGREAVANYVYVGDVVEACLVAAGKRLTGEHIVADSCPLSDFVARMAHALKCAEPRLRLPTTAGYALAVLFGLGTSVLGRRNPLTIGRVRALSSRTRYDASRLRSTAGWRPTTGWAGGIDLTVAWYREGGLLK